MAMYTKAVSDFVTCVGKEKSIKLFERLIKGGERYIRNEGPVLSTFVYGEKSAVREVSIRYSGEVTNMARCLENNAAKRIGLESISVTQNPALARSGEKPTVGFFINSHNVKEFEKCRNILPGENFHHLNGETYYYSGVPMEKAQSFFKALREYNA